LDGNYLWICIHSFYLAQINITKCGHNHILVTNVCLLAQIETFERFAFLHNALNLLAKGGFSQLFSFFRTSIFSLSIACEFKATVHLSITYSNQGKQKPAIGLKENKMHSNLHLFVNQPLVDMQMHIDIRYTYK